MFPLKKKYILSFSLCLYLSLHFRNFDSDKSFGMNQGCASLFLEKNVQVLDSSYNTLLSTTERLKVSVNKIVFGGRRVQMKIIITKSEKKIVRKKMAAKANG